MPDDHYTRQDPRSQHPWPDQLAGQKQEHPGSSEQMGPSPITGAQLPGQRPQDRDHRWRLRHRPDRRRGIRQGGADVLLSYLDESGPVWTPLTPPPMPAEQVPSFGAQTRPVADWQRW
jgi:hypothetical protein